MDSSNSSRVAVMWCEYEHLDPDWFIRWRSSCFILCLALRNVKHPFKKRERTFLECRGSCDYGYLVGILPELRHCKLHVIWTEMFAYSGLLAFWTRGRGEKSLISVTRRIDWKCTINSPALSWLLMLFKPNLYVWVLGSSTRSAWAQKDGLDGHVSVCCIVSSLFLANHVALSPPHNRLLSVHSVNPPKVSLIKQSAMFLHCFCFLNNVSNILSVKVWALLWCLGPMMVPQWGKDNSGEHIYFEPRFSAASPSFPHRF